MGSDRDQPLAISRPGASAEQSVRGSRWVVQEHLTTPDCRFYYHNTFPIGHPTKTSRSIKSDLLSNPHSVRGLQQPHLNTDSAGFTSRLYAFGLIINSTFQTASHADLPSTSLSPPTLDVRKQQQLQHSRRDAEKYNPSSEPINTTSATQEIAVTADQDPPWEPQQPAPRQPPRRNLLARTPFRPENNILQAPLDIAEASTQPLHQHRLIGRPAAARLWNPTNSTPRPPPRKQSSRIRRTSTPPPPNVPLDHPVINETANPRDLIGTGAGDYPLLTLPQQRQNKHPAATRASLQIEGRASGDYRISLPRSLRHSYDGKPGLHSPPAQDAEAGPSYQRPPTTDSKPKVSGLRKRGQSVTSRARALSFGLVRQDRQEDHRKADKGKGKAIMAPSDIEEAERSFSKDLERGPGSLAPRQSHDNASLPDGLGSPISSTDSSIMGDPDQPDMGEEWGPQHPCFPHLNPHVPMDSAEYATTRIIRIRRDWLLEGDLAPTFSNLYPEILDPAGISEQEFRRVIEKLNHDLVPIFNPYYWRNIVDGVMGLVTGWIWDDLGLTYTKSRLKTLELWIDKWNIEMEKTIGTEDSAMAPKIVPLRRTGYMNLDIQIPDPEIAPAVTASQPNSRSGLPAEPEPAVTVDRTGDAQP
ncbi:Golgin subfamily A member 7/ERF4 family-domain-containing protein [Apiospora arundinis]